MNTLKKNWLTTLSLFTLFSCVTYGQPDIGIMYFTSDVTSEYWTQKIADDLQDMVTSELSSIGTIRPLEREHVLLLLKEIDPPKIDNLDHKVILELGKKEKLQYLVKGNLMAFELKGNVITYQIRIVIYKTSDASVFWEKAPEITRELTDQELKEHILLKAELYETTILAMTKEIRKLRFQ